jgi:ABC-type dipeptide/oligopeptide/nickel transport system ATPase subunit
MSKLTVRVEQDEFTAKVAQAFDYEGGWNGIIETKIPDFEFPEYNSYNIGLIVGASGSGKSTILRNLVESDEEKKRLCLTLILQMKPLRSYMLVVLHQYLHYASHIKS